MLARRRKKSLPVASRPIEGDRVDARWRSRPWLARSIRWSILLVPVILTFLFALLMTNIVAEPDGHGMRILRWIAIAVASTLLLLGLQRISKRFLPLAALFSLTLVFPDTAPSRFGLALRTGTTRQLEAKLGEVGTNGLGETPRESAEQLLELIASLNRHDRMTRGHSERVRAYARMIAEELEMPEEDIERLHWAGLLHDVGKMYVPEEILNKPGALTDEEFEIIKAHTVHGQMLVAGLYDWLGESTRAVWEHHERWEGGGYPTGVTGDQTALASRIVCVADAFDVMTSARSYKVPVSASEARAELERCAGTQFDPSVVRAMLTISLGRLWAAMGPLSLIAQIRLFPRPLVQGGAAAATTLAALLAMLLTGFAAGFPTGGADDSVAAAETPLVVTSTTDAAPIATTATVVDPPAPSTSPTAASPPSSQASTAATTTTTTTTSTTTTTTSTTTTTTSTTSTIPATTTSPPTTVVRTTAAPTTVRPRVTPTVTPPPTFVAPPTTTAPVTTTTIPSAPARFTLGSSAAGDVAASSVLPLVERAPVNVAGDPNYDTDRNAAPWLTLLRSSDSVDSTDSREVQIWRAPAGVRTLVGPVRLQMWFGADGAAGAGFVVIAARLSDCAEDGTGCVTLADDLGVFIPRDGQLDGVSFTLTPPTGDHTLGAGRVMEVKIASPDSSVADVIVAYDSNRYPSTVTFG